jgi:hypothetical protein
MNRTVLKGLAGTFALWGLGIVALRVVILPAQVCPAVTGDGVLQAAGASAGWMQRAQQPDGSFAYEYNRNSDVQTAAYNSVRHGGVVLALDLLAADDPSVLPTADRGLEWMRSNLIQHENWSALRDPNTGTVETGGSALMLAGLAQRRAATHDTTYDGLMHQLANYLLVMEQPDGSVLLLWLPDTGVPDPVQRSKYATGEAFWALTLMRREFPNERWEAPSRAVANYLSNHRDSQENYDYPPWVDQWAAYGLAEMASWPLNDDNIRYARSLSERFGFLVRVESQRRATWWSKLIHGRRARAAGIATWSEALDSLWRLASADPRMADMRDKIGERATCAAGMVASRQQTPAQAAGYKQPSLVAGAWYTEGVTRMDDQQHALSGLVLSRDVLDSRRSKAK